MISQVVSKSQSNYYNEAYAEMQVSFLKHKMFNHVTNFNDEIACQSDKITKQDLPGHSKSYFHAVCRILLGQNLQQIIKQKHVSYQLE